VPQMCTEAMRPCLKVDDFDLRAHLGKMTGCERAEKRTKWQKLSIPNGIKSDYGHMMGMAAAAFCRCLDSLHSLDMTVTGIVTR